MYSLEQRRVAIETFIKFGYSYADTIAELGYPNRQSLRSWWNDYREHGEVRPGKPTREPRFPPGDAARDRRRIEGLEHMGWSINTADLHEMREFRRLWDLAGLLKGKVPRVTEASPLYKETRALHEQLLEATRFNLGLETALFGVEVPRGLVKYHI